MRKSTPGLLWVSIAALAIMTVWFLLLGFKGLSGYTTLSAGVSEQSIEELSLSYFRDYSILFLGTAILSVLLLVGLVLGRRWGYVLSLIYVLFAIAFSFGQGPSQGIMTALMFAPVVVPVLICTKFFFRSEMPDSASQEPEEA